MTEKSCVLVLSGGQDSTTCAFWAKNEGFKINALTFNYGQRHQREIHAANKIAQLVGVESHETVNIGPILKGSSPLVSDTALEQYKDHQSLPGGIEKTFIPMRNQVFLTLAYNRASLLNADAIVTGVCEEDYGGYPDCRQVFIDAIITASNLALFGYVDQAANKFAGWISIHTPLMHLTKARTVSFALTFPGCYEALAYSHTSYDGAFPPTGHDHATLLRAKGFEEAMIPDPLILRCVWKGLMSLPQSPNYETQIVDRYMDLLIPFFEENEE